MKIVAFVNTEYHLMLCMNEILKNPDVEFNVYITLKSNHNRLNFDLDFSGVHNAKFEVLRIQVDFKGLFSIDHKDLLNSILAQNYDRLYFFQEQDALMLSVIKKVKKQQKHCEVCLFQDGLKPYNRMKRHSLGMTQWDINTWRWLWRNGIREVKPLKLLYTKEYAYTDEVDYVYLTFPESYDNWNRKSLVKIEFCQHQVYKAALEKLFRWNDNLIPVKDDAILYMCKPVKSHKPSVEFEFLHKLKSQLNKPLILKLHPQSTEEDLKAYKKIGDDVHIIYSLLPGELFIMNLTNSVIVSWNSTSLFYNSPSNRYYYTVNLFRDKVKRLQSYIFTKSPSPHIKMIEKIEEIY